MEFGDKRSVQMVGSLRECLWSGGWVVFLVALVLPVWAEDVAGQNTRVVEAGEGGERGKVKKEVLEPGEEPMEEPLGEEATTDNRGGPEVTHEDDHGVASDRSSRVVEVPFAEPTADCWQDPPQPFPFERQESIAEPVFGGRACIYLAGLQNTDTVMLVHGISSLGALDWNLVVPALANRFRIVAVDLPGFGQSGRDNHLYTPESYVAFLKFVADKVIENPFMLVGHSMGAAISVRYAALFPKDVERLVLISAAGILHPVTYTGLLTKLQLGEILPKDVPLQKSLAKFGGTFIRTMPQLNAEMQMVLASPEGRQRFLGGEPASIAGLSLLLDDFSPLIAGVVAPTLVIWGAEDTIAPPRTGKVLAQNISGARLVVIDGSGHVPLQDASETLSALLMEELLPPLETDPAADDGDVAGDDPPSQTPLVEANGKSTANSDDAPSGEQEFRAREGYCKGQSGMVFEGDYDMIYISRCKDVLLRNVRARSVKIKRSRVEIDSSSIQGEGVALDVTSSVVVITGGVIDGSVAIRASNSRMDLAGVSLIGQLAAVRSRKPSSMVFSVSRIKSPLTQSLFLHGPLTVTSKNPL